MHVQQRVTLVRNVLRACIRLTVLLSLAPSTRPLSSWRVLFDDHILFWRRPWLLQLIDVFASTRSKHRVLAAFVMELATIVMSVKVQNAVLTLMPAATHASVMPS